MTPVKIFQFLHAQKFDMGTLAATGYLPSEDTKKYMPNEEYNKLVKDYEDLNRHLLF